MKQRQMAAVATTHRKRLEQLDSFLAERANDVHAAANLMLDALTVSDSEIARLNRTLLMLNEQQDTDPRDGILVSDSDDDSDVPLISNH